MNENNKWHRIYAPRDSFHQSFIELQINGVNSVNFYKKKLPKLTDDE